MDSSKAIAKRVRGGILPARFAVRLRIEPSALRACFEAQRDVRVGDAWPKDDGGRHWYLAKAMPGDGLRLRIAPERATTPVIPGLSRQPLEVELRLTTRIDGEETVVEASYALAPTSSLGVLLFYPGLGLLLGSVALAGIWGLALALAAFVAILWPRNLHDEAKDLRNKVSAALGPVLAQGTADGVYR